MFSQHFGRCITSMSIDISLLFRIKAGGVVAATPKEGAQNMCMHVESKLVWLVDASKNQHAHPHTSCVLAASSSKYNYVLPPSVVLRTHGQKKKHEYNDMTC